MTGLALTFIAGLICGAVLLAAFACYGVGIEARDEAEREDFWLPTANAPRPD